MLRSILGTTDLTLGPTIAFIIFAFCFGAILLRVFSRKNKPHYDYMARLSLEDGVNPPTEKHHG